MDCGNGIILAIVGYWGLGKKLEAIPRDEAPSKKWFGRPMGWNYRDPKAIFSSQTYSLVAGTKPGFSLEFRSLSKDSAGQTLYGWKIRPSELSVPSDTELPPLSDHYSRQNDFIAVYGQKYPWPFSYQIDVRVLPSSNHLLVFELWLSIQTLMLECEPQLILDAAPQVSNDPGSRGHVAVVVHPLDRDDCKIDFAKVAASSNVTASNESSNKAVTAGSAKGPKQEISRITMFGKFMEKGVIRRGRVLFVGSSQPIDPVELEEQVNRFASSSLPLTA